jgi:hypothetical protein
MIKQISMANRQQSKRILRPILIFQAYLLFWSLVIGYCLELGIW